MQSAAAAALALLLAGSLPATGLGSYIARKAARTQSLRPSEESLRPSEEGLVQPFRFDQRLIVCNAYPSASPVLIRKNGHEMLADAKNALSFRACRYIRSRVQPHDKLDMMLRDVEIHGTFEVGTLPASDAVLLLVLEKRDSSTPLVSFQSLAFPATDGKKDAQLAVIDAFRGNATVPHLRMEDHMTGKEEKTVSKRVEQLSFNRVYPIEEGTYDASIAGHSAKKLLKLARSQNYILLRTGEDGHFEESLVLYPEQGPQQSGSRPLASAEAWALALAVLVAALAA